MHRQLHRLLVLCSLGLVAAGCTREPSSPTARASASDAAPATAASAAAPATASAPPPAPDPRVLRVCADPGNMPLSNKAGEGFQNKIAQVVAEAMGRRLEYEWRTYYQRGLARSTITAGRCDVLMDLNSDFEQGLTTRPLYRSAYVLVTRKGLDLVPTSLDDPALKKLRLGVFQRLARTSGVIRARHQRPGAIPVLRLGHRAGRTSRQAG